VPRTINEKAPSDPTSAEQNTHDAFATKPSGAIDLVGQAFWRWTVISVHPERDRNGRLRWRCRCSCGSERAVRADSLRGGGTLTAC
jgi:hypothetical protein